MQIYILQYHIHRIPDTRRIPGGYGYGSIFYPIDLVGMDICIRVGYYQTRTQPDPLPSLIAILTLIWLWNWDNAFQISRNSYVSSKIEK